MISLLLPSRGRPDWLRRLWQSVQDTADKPRNVEMVVYVDNDDDSYGFKLPLVRFVRGERIILSEMWNECYKISIGEICGHMGDDIVFASKGWDTLLINKFREYGDRIVFVHGDDCSGVHGPNFGTHGFIHRKWASAVGYFVPPYFSSDYNDTWLNDVANTLGRRVYIDEIKTDHRHYIFNKSVKDQTYQDRLDRGVRDKVDEVYHSHEMWERRMGDAKKLRGVIDEYKRKARK